MKTQQHPFLIFAMTLELITLFVLAGFTGYTLIKQVAASQHLYEVSERRANSLQRATELRQSSDDLSRMMRTYAATGEERFLGYFKAILDIRNGVIPRPANYNQIYWDFVVSTNKDYVPAPGKGTPLRQLMMQAGIKPEELALLEEAQSKSDQLVEMEDRATHIVKEALQKNGGHAQFHDGGNEEALKILFGREYHAAKRDIMHSINIFMKTVEIRTDDEFNSLFNDIKTLGRNLRYALIALLVTAPLFVVTISIYQFRIRSTLQALLNSKSIEVQQRIEAEKDLVRSRNNLQVTLDSIGDAVISTDSNGLITHLNPIAELITGWHRTEAVGMSVDEIFSITDPKTDERIASPIRQVLTTGKACSMHAPAVLTGKSGTRVQVSDSVAPIRMDNGDLFGTVLVFRDITEELKIQERMRHSTKMEAVGQLAGGIAHDFNNMLGAILSAAELVRFKSGKDDRIAKHVEVIIEAAKRAADLTKKLLQFSRKQPKTSTPTDVHVAINTVRDILRETINKKITIETHTNAEDHTTLGDQSLIQSALMNLGINASHAMPDGGTITISTRNVLVTASDKESGLLNIAPGKYIYIDFADTGTGIPKDVLPKIFEPFFTTKEQGKGTGLGLSSVFGTIQQHAGAITVYSEEGSGTCFKIWLPVVEAEEPLQVAEVKTYAKRSGTILLVDDEPLMRIVGESLLRELGYDVVLASDGEQAVEIFRERHDDICIVLLDMIMPHMDGKEAYRLMRQITPDVRVILSSGFSRDNDLDEMRKEGVCAFIEKPYQIDTLTKALDSISCAGK
ncbi:MAG: response regulator [Halodesulfovibrio sp.]